MNDCGDCEGMTQGSVGMDGHERLISLGEVRSLAAFKGRVRHEMYVCSICGAQWDYVGARRGGRGEWLRQ